MSNHNLVVFDLDLTLWSFRVDECRPPFKVRQNSVTDSTGKVLTLYPDTLEILQTLRAYGYKMAVASCIKDICGAFQLLVIFKIARYFQHIEIYPVSKGVHFKIISGKCGIPFDKMVFFDDDQRNIRTVKKLGVRTMHIKKGITMRRIQCVLKIPFAANSLRSMK